MNISRNLRKNIILLVLSFGLTVLVGCSAREVNCSNSGDNCSNIFSNLWLLFSNLWLIFRLGLVGLLFIITFILWISCLFALAIYCFDVEGRSKFFKNLTEVLSATTAFTVLLFLAYLLFDFNLRIPRALISEHIEPIFNPIKKVELNINSLEEYIVYEVIPLIGKYESEYKSLYTDLENELTNRNIGKHEELLAKCDEYEYLRLCNLLEKTAITKHSLNWLSNKYKEADSQKIKLEQNKWKLEKQIALNEVASNEDKETVNKLINYTQTILEESLTPPQAQDRAKIQQQIFNEIVNK